MRPGVLILVLATALAACSASDQSEAKKDATSAATDAAHAASQAGAAVNAALNSDTGQHFKDGLLGAAIKARLASSDIDATTNVAVHVTAGVVTLGGRVHSAGEAEKLVREAREIKGVKSVSSELRVDPKAPSAANSASEVGLEARIRAALVGQAGTNAFKVNVAVHGDAVALSGTVPTPAIKMTIVDTVRKTAGVRTLSESIAVHE